MKKIILSFPLIIFLAVFSVKELKAQAPKKISYQAVVRSANNSLQVNAPVGMRISILQGASTGVAVYQETQTPTSNANGLVTVEIGTGTVTSGAFSGISWALGPYFIKTEYDLSGGANYTMTATQELLSVPYALYAETSANLTGPVTSVGNVTAIGNGVITTAMLANVNANAGTFNNVTVNAKGQVTAASTVSYESPLTFSTGLARTGSTITNTLSTGKAGSQSVVGGTAASENLTLSSTSNATKGKILVGNSAYVESNNRLGLGTVAPQATLDIVGTIKIADGTQANGKVLTSDANGLASWKTSPNSLAGDVAVLNTFIGYQTGASNTTGLANVATGYQAFASNTTGWNNTANGYQALYSNIGGDDNVALGRQALYANTFGRGNVAVGMEAAIANTQGNFNTVAGYRALRFNLTGSWNSVNGMEALQYNTTGNYNVANGTTALINNTTGGYNVAIGAAALYYNITGSFNTAIGSGAGASTNLTNTTSIGNGAYANTSNTMVFGNTAVVGWGFGTPPGAAAIRVGSDGTNGNGATLSLGGTWTNASDRHKKENFTTIDGWEILSKVEQLPITRWNYIGEDPTITHIGPMAQDFHDLFQVGQDEKSISTIDPSGVALTAIQELTKQNRELKRMLESLQLVIDQMEKEDRAVKTELASLRENYDSRLKKLEELLGAEAKK